MPSALTYLVMWWPVGNTKLAAASNAARRRLGTNTERPANIYLNKDNRYRHHHGRRSRPHAGVQRRCAFQGPKPLHIPRLIPLNLQPQPGTPPGPLHPRNLHLPRHHARGKASDPQPLPRTGRRLPPHQPAPQRSPRPQQQER
ncbi:hypothetical protein GE09DRAFT_1075944 [Coniochaeta sp. 2T2.1]|nr:hypothetical protein GE09DRAFT_1075944 [Coniochaeta sp. 2T2.1]